MSCGASGRSSGVFPVEGNPPKLPDWFPKDSAPEDPAAKSPDLPAARNFVARTNGLSADKVEAMSPAQVLLLYIVGTCREDWDDFYRAAYLPYPQARPFFEAADKRLREALPRGDTWCHAPLFRFEQGHVETDRARAHVGRPASHRGLADACRRS